MYRDRLINTPVTTDGARYLQRQLLAYHDFRNSKARHPLGDQLPGLSHWQAERLKRTHQDLYRQPDFHDGLNFLLTDLYAPAGMTRRDDNIDRIFPKMVKWLPDHLLTTMAGLVELNLATQQLDIGLAETLQRMGHAVATPNEQHYCEAYRQSGQQGLRRQQIDLVARVGGQLDRYVRNRSLGWLLSMTRTPAEMAGLEDLHNFLHRGYQAFRAMEGVDQLIHRLVARESRVLEQILAGTPSPFNVTEETQACPVS